MGAVLSVMGAPGGTDPSVHPIPTQQSSVDGMQVNHYMESLSKQAEKNIRKQF